MFKNFHNSLNSLTSISIQFTTASHTYILTHGIAKAFLSVCLFIKGVHCDKTKETCTHILITHESKFILVFRHEEWLVGDDSLVPEILGRTDPFEQKRGFSIDIRS